MEASTKKWAIVAVAAVVVVGGAAGAVLLTSRGSLPAPAVGAGANVPVPSATPVPVGDGNIPAASVLPAAVPHPELEFDVEKIMTAEEKAERGIDVTGEVRYKYVRDTSGGVVMVITSGLKDPMLDTDGDGIPDGGESLAGTDPKKFDTDGDGVSDGVELGNGSDPKDPASKNTQSKPKK